MPTSSVATVLQLLRLLVRSFSSSSCCAVLHGALVKLRLPPRSSRRAQFYERDSRRARTKEKNHVSTIAKLLREENIFQPHLSSLNA